MTLVSPAKQCPITYKKRSEVAPYQIGFKKVFPENGKHWFYFTPYCNTIIVNDELFCDINFWNEYRREVEYLLHNSLWPGDHTMMNKGDLLALIKLTMIPNTQIEKLMELVLHLKSATDFFGKKIQFKKEKLFNIHLIKRLGMINSAELEQVIYAGINLGFLKDEGISNDSCPVSITMKGWEEAEKLQSKKRSKVVSIAISSDPEMILVYDEWIMPAITELGLESNLVFDRYPKSDFTINDAILARIKKAKFMIADFTHYDAGVYFEAGYALGRGQEVIYTCREDHIGSAKLDTKNFQHLVWKDGADLKKKLMDKIEVYIKA